MLQHVGQTWTFTRVSWCSDGVKWVGGWGAVKFLLHLDAYLMLRYLQLTCTCAHIWCYAAQRPPSKHWRHFDGHWQKKLPRSCKKGDLGWWRSGHWKTHCEFKEPIHAIFLIIFYPISGLDSMADGGCIKYTTCREWCTNLVLGNAFKILRRWLRACSLTCKIIGRAIPCKGRFLQLQVERIPKNNVMTDEKADEVVWLFRTKSTR